MNRIHVIGHKNQGKTTLVVELLKQLGTMGFKVGAIKHTHHAHQLDVPGKDSFRFGEVGAHRIGILSEDQIAIFVPTGRRDGGERDSERVVRSDYEVFSATFADCDLVLVEGDSRTTAPKVEVWRAGLGSPPLAVEDESILAVITDDEAPAVGCPVWPRQPIAQLAERMSEVAELHDGRRG